MQQEMKRVYEEWCAAIGSYWKQYSAFWRHTIQQLEIVQIYIGGMVRNLQ